MKLKMFTIAAVAMTLGGAAFAQTATTGAGTDPAPQMKVLSDKTMMTPFYTDDTMTTMRTDDEMSTIFKGLKDDQQVTMKEECKLAATMDQYKDFCAKVDAM
ncbi:hypothetical protein GA830_11290 [Mesorhizobium sp. NBSH29]|uniref:hypothetical protein n=1 Tax=Mesorhizobium sp. NBSH29 TaxID=2654249 RepID=UPI0018969D0C|nr:hypothetical protein [Mesorhizobium sp. NBSH29]QPC87259.1 hypothetical protein GA830_11290 [Mesorhizobium sp. NBSH29]